MKNLISIRFILTTLALAFAAGLLYTLYHIGYIVPQYLSDVFAAKASPAQQQAEANRIITQIFVYVSVELVIALMLVITLAIYVNNSQKSNIVYVERSHESQRNDNSKEQQQVSTNEYIAKQLFQQINELLQQAETTHSADKLLLEQLLTRVCHATDAVAGACFVCNNDAQTIRGVASFALSQQLSTEPFAYGEGFVGQVAKSGKLLYLHPVPENYLLVKTGLGNAQPTSLLYLPIAQDGRTVGVIELGLFKQLSENLLENLQKNIHLSSPLFSGAHVQANNS